MSGGLTFRNLLDYTSAENGLWHRWFAARSLDVLDLPFAEPPIDSVRRLIQHVAFVEHRYAAMLAGRAAPTATGSDADLVDTIFAYLADGRLKLEETISEAIDAGLERTIEIRTLSAGLQHVSARKAIGHALMHGIRHWAQLATVLREHGQRTNWGHDLLFTTAFP